MRDPRVHRLGTAGGLHRAEKPLSARARDGPILLGRAQRPLGSSGALVPINPEENHHEETHEDHSARSAHQRDAGPPG